LLSPREVDPVITVDAAAVTDTVVALEGEARILPTEPAFALAGNGALGLVPGVPGTGIDPADVADALPDAILGRDDPTGPIVVTVEPEPIDPEMTDDAVQALVDDLNTTTGVPLTVVVAGSTADLSPAAVRSWLRPSPDPEGGEPTYTVDQEAALTSLREALPEVGSGSVDARFDLQNGLPVVIPSRDGTGCCADDTAERIRQTLEQDAHTVTLELGSDPADLTTETAQSWGITQAVGGNRAWPESRQAGAAPGFTTFHAAGEARVTNIHRMADIVRGAVIPPGESFSINEYVGQRTTEKGFVAAGAIRNGEHVSEVGGGVSQFATTLFNAAYFAGLDIPTYQAHSEYFDRYPRGREATMGYPNPDLVIENTTPYGVMIWTSYTGSSLTITLYSTPYASGEQTGIDESRSGNCRVVTTTRTRTYVDGRPPVQDTFRATYRPGEGQFC
jgi:vancomycin resistance protein YoaR